MNKKYSTLSLVVAALVFCFLAPPNMLSQSGSKVIWERFILTNSNFSYTKDIAKIDDTTAVLATRFNDEMHSAVIKINSERGEFLWTQDNLEEYPVMLDKVRQFSDGSINAIGTAFPDTAGARPYFIKLNGAGDKMTSVCNTLETYALGGFTSYYFYKKQDRYAVVSTDAKNNKSMNLFLFGSVGELRKTLQFSANTKFISGTVTENDKGELLISLQSDSIRNYIVNAEEKATLVSTIPTEQLICHLSTHSSGMTYLFSKLPSDAFAHYDVLGVDNQFKSGNSVVSIPENIPSYLGGFANMHYNILAGYSRLVGSLRETRFLLSGYDEQMKNNFDFSWGKSMQNSKLVTALQLNEKEFLVAGERGFSDDTTTRMIYVARVSINRTVSVFENMNTLQASLYPNPAAESVFISCENLKSVSIFNSLGKIVFLGKEPIIDISSFPAGNYFVKINNSPKTIPLVVSR